MDPIDSAESSPGLTEGGHRLLRHVVILTFADHAPADLITNLAPQLRAMSTTIPGLVRYAVGRDAGIDAGNGSFAVVGEFVDEAAYAAYRDDPTHQEIIATLVRPNLLSRAAAQYWVSTAS